jgi:hypothetical protein
LILSGRPFLLLDNVRGAINSPLLETVLRGPGTATVRVPYGKYTDVLSAAAVFSISPVYADEVSVTTVGLEVHASSSMTIGDADRISHYFFHNIAKWSPGAAMVVYEGDSRGGGAKMDLNVVIYVSKLGRTYSFFVETTDEVALRKELTEKGISRPDVDALLGDPKSPLTRTSGTSWGTVPESELNENLDEIIKNIVSIVRRVEEESPPTTRIQAAPSGSPERK